MNLFGLRDAGAPKTHGLPAGADGGPNIPGTLIPTSTRTPRRGSTYARRRDLLGRALPPAPLWCGFFCSGSSRFSLLALVAAVLIPYANTVPDASTPSLSCESRRTSSRLRIRYTPAALVTPSRSAHYRSRYTQWSGRRTRPARGRSSLIRPPLAGVWEFAVFKWLLSNTQRVTLSLYGLFRSEAPLVANPMALR